MKQSWFIAAFLFLTGCAVGPNYKAPENNISSTFETQKISEEVSSDDPPLEWWKIFDDSLLNKYMLLASEYNNDLLAATSSILQARAFKKIDASAFYPKLNADVNAVKTYFSKNGPVFTFDTTQDTPGIPFLLQIPQVQNLYNFLFNASWEIDLFGKTRRKVEAAEATIQKAMEDRNDIFLSVMAEIAENYIELRNSQNLVTLIKEKIALLEVKSMITRLQFQFGYVNRLNTESISATLSEEKARLPNIEAKIYQSIYALSVLTGAVPEALIEELLPSKQLPKIPDCIAVGLKSDLLRRRPDIRSAERNLAAATAHIGVAVAEFFPTFTLLGDGGLQSLLLKNLFTLGSKTWDYGGDFNLPIFQGGKLVGNLNAKKADAAKAGYIYQQTVLKALEEAESSLIAYKETIQSLKDLKDSNAHYKSLLCLNQERYLKGLTNRIDLIDAELQLNESDQSILNKDKMSLINIVNLYKSLGGGWEALFSEKDLESSDTKSKKN